MSEIHHTYRIINKPLTWYGCDKWLVLNGFIIGVTFYGAFGATLPGLIVGGLFLILARVKVDDPVRMSMLVVPRRERLPRYDPGKREPFVILFK